MLMRKVFIKGLFICIFLIICLYTKSADSKEDISRLNRFFYKGNSLYEQGQYDKAIAEYSHILKDGFASGNLFYNLGNCYFKEGELGMAILNYERALRLMPRDRDLESNYRFARSNMTRYVAVRKKWYLNLCERAFGKMTINELTIFLSSLYCVFGALLILAGFINGRPKRYLYYISIVLCIVGFFGIFSLIDKIDRVGKEAIIIVEKTDAKFEPFKKATAHFTLYEGMKVYIISKRDQWLKIKRADGKTGWVKSAHLEII